MIIIAVLIVGGIVASVLLRPEKKPEYSTSKVYRGELKQTVSVIGTVRPKKVIDLVLEQNGVVGKINVRVGEEVSKGDLLLSLDSSTQRLQVTQAEASLNLAQSNLKMAETHDLRAAQTAYNQSYQTYLNTKAANERALLDAEVALDEAKNYTKDYQEYFDEVNSEHDAGNLAQYTRDLARAALTQAQGNERKVKEALESLKVSNKQTEDAAWYLQEQARQAVKRQEALGFDPQKSNLINQVDYSKAGLDLVRNSLAKSWLTSSLSAIVSKINIEEGEGALAYSPLIQLASKELEIEVKIPESDISQVKLDQEIEITLDALSDEELTGKVSAMEPTETIIEGVTYYQIKIKFSDPEGLVRSGMTADLSIKIYTKNDVLIAPHRAVKEKDGRKYVEILEGEEIREVDVVVGLRGDGGTIEIIDGLKEEDEVVTFIKEQK